MEPSSDMHIQASNQQVYSFDRRSAAESSSRILQHGSGNVGLESVSKVIRAEEEERLDRKSAGSAVESKNINRDNTGKRPRERRKRRLRPYPWERDPNFIRYEFQSERYVAYRNKARQSNDQKWPDEVEDCLQYGMNHLLTFP